MILAAKGSGPFKTYEISHLGKASVSWGGGEFSRKKNDEIEWEQGQSC